MKTQHNVLNGSPVMGTTFFVAAGLVLLLFSAAVFTGCTKSAPLLGKEEYDPNVVDEAMQRLRNNEKLPKLEPGDPDYSQENEYQNYFPTHAWDNFRGMDGRFVAGNWVPGDLSQEEVKGRNTWLMWTGGNQGFWKKMD